MPSPPEERAPRRRNLEARAVSEKGPGVDQDEEKRAVRGREERDPQALTRSRTQQRTQKPRQTEPVETGPPHQAAQPRRKDEHTNPTKEDLVCTDEILDVKNCFFVQGRCSTSIAMACRSTLSGNCESDAFKISLSFDILLPICANISV